MPKTREQRRRLFQNGFRKRNRQILHPATIGKLTSDGSHTIFVDNNKNIVYARLIDDENKIVQAYCMSIQPRANLDVWLRETLDGWEVDSIRNKRADETIGKGAGGLNVPTIPGELLNTIIPANNYEPGHLRLASEDTLIVHVEPFWYSYFGTRKRFPGGTLDLGDYLPTTSNYWQWVQIGIWPYDGQLYAVTSDEYANRASLTTNVLEDLGTSMEGLIPSDAVQVQEGATTIAYVEYFQHGRLSADGIGLGAFPTRITSAYYHIPADRKVVWPETVTYDGGTMTIEGTLLIR